MAERQANALTFRNEPSPVFLFPVALEPASAAAMVQLAESRASAGGPAADGKGFTCYMDPRASNTGAEDWPELLRGRVDIPFTMQQHGGRFGRALVQKKAGQFRDTFAYGNDEGPVHAFVHNPLFKEAACKIHPGRTVIEPHIVFANFYLPGEHQSIHTDVPEFRGVSRKNAPEWMLVCMHHSGLFERWYMPIATAVAWFSHHQGGELVYYPDPAKPGKPCATPYNTAIMIDTDSIYHGVDPVGAPGIEAPRIPMDATLIHVGEGCWQVRDAEGNVLPGYKTLTWQEIRMSVQWKAYCFRDEAERDTWRNHSDDLTTSDAFATLVAELVRRGRAEGHEPREALVGTLVTEFIRVPDELQQPHGMFAKL